MGVNIQNVQDILVSVLDFRYFAVVFILNRDILWLWVES